MRFLDEKDAAYIGITGEEVTSDVQQLYGMPAGIYIANVGDNTPASDAGLTRGMIITKFDDTSVSSMSDLTDLLQYYKGGETVTVTVAQQGEGGKYKESDISLKLGLRSDYVSKCRAAGEIAVPCTCNPLQQGSCRTEAVSLRSSPSQVMLTSGSLATGSCEPCQGGNTAALSRSFCVPRDRLDRVNYEGTVRGEPSKRGARLKSKDEGAAQGAVLFSAPCMDGSMIFCNQSPFL